jgi:3-hydroxyisobutyrate dehydrogenase-like beta-hydroxyacid dehydrogenase
MPNLTVGLVHPGAMGATVGAAAVSNVRRVLWASEGRSEATRKRASGAGLEDAVTLRALVGGSDLIVSVCPPGSALDLAREIATFGYTGIYVDANAVSPRTAREIAGLFDGTEADFVDGGIVGPPAARAGTTRLHLSGERASEVARCFAVGPFEVFVVEGSAGSASALKMAFAAYTKGTTALLASIYAVARAEGVESQLIREWEKFLPDLPARLRAGVPGGALKAWRFVGEMKEIASTFEAVGLPGGFHRAAAEVYEKLSSFKDASESPSVDAVADRLVSHARPAKTR